MGISIGSIELGHEPRIAAVLSDKDVSNLNKEETKKADILELRVDMFENLSVNYAKKVFRSAVEKFGKPLIATVRHSNEGGVKVISEDERFAIYKAIEPLSHAIDIEIQCSHLIAKMQVICKPHDTLIIGSYHNLEGTPDENTLRYIVDKGTALGVNIVKLVTTAKNREDMGRLLCFTIKHKSKHLITFTMGSQGVASRVFSPLMGSLLTYGYITEPAAPGQLSVDELSQAFKQFAPEQS